MNQEEPSQEPQITVGTVVGEEEQALLVCRTKKVLGRTFALAAPLETLVFAEVVGDELRPVPEDQISDLQLAFYPPE